MVDVGAVRLQVAEAGEGGRPFLLLHGFTGAKEDFSEWLDRLAGAGWHAVAPDHRGHGASSKPDGLDAYSFSILATDARGLADALGWDRFALLGHSMGGYVAQRVALADPARLRGLVLMDTGHRAVEGIDPSLVALAGQLARESGMAALAAVMAERQSPLDTAANQRVLKERPGYAEFGERKFLDSSPWMFEAMMTELLTAEDTLEDLAALSPAPPTLVIVGEQDTPFLDPSKRMADAVPGGRLAVIPDAGHSPQFESPDTWWQVLSAFLDAIA